MSRALIGTVLLTLGALAASRPVGAQSATRPLVGIAAGADIQSAGGPPTVWLAQGSVQWRERASGLGVRAELSYIERGREENRFYPVLPTLPCASPGCPPSLSLSEQVRGVSAMLSGAYEFLHRAPVRPYVISGIGVLTTRTRVESRSLPTPCLACRAPYADIALPGVDASSYSSTALVLNGGAGVVVDVARVQLFTELRYQLADQPSIRGLSGIAPLTLGIRF